MNLCIRLVVLLTAGFVSLTAWCGELTTLEAFHLRSGLPGLAQAVRVGGTVRVAFLGGSITAADGWRTLTTSFLRARWPGVEFEEITAGLSGTGSDLGACRLGYDVLRHQPDLLVVEFAVNDATTPPARIKSTMEGIVRQTRTVNPKADILFVYTVSKVGLPQLEAGAFPTAALAMEAVAEHYGIPSLHFGVEVARRVVAGTLEFQGKDADDPHVFTLDGVHPTRAGHQIYFEQIERVLPRLVAESGASRPTPPPLMLDNWEGATLRLMVDLAREGDWHPVPMDDPNLRGTVKAMLPPLLRAEVAGAALQFRFHGRRFGLFGISAPDSGRFRVTVDDRPPVLDTLFDAYASPTFCRARGWFYPDELPEGMHTVRVEWVAEPLDKVAVKRLAGKVIDDPAPYAPQRLTLGGVLLVETKTP